MRQLTPKETKEILHMMGFESQFNLVNVMPVWSDGKKIRRYQGQDKSNFNSNNGKNRKMIAILVEVEE